MVTRPVAVITVLAAAGAVAVCAPEVRAYHRLLALARSVRDQATAEPGLVGMTPASSTSGVNA